MKEEPKQVIVVRKDLNMRKGKIAAQCSHASMKVFFDRITEFNSDDEFMAISYLPQEAFEWIEGSFVKIIVGCDTKDELESLIIDAEVAGILTGVIIDEGRTELKEPAMTCVAFGPAYPSKLNKLTGHLKLL